METGKEGGLHFEDNFGDFEEEDQIEQYVVEPSRKQVLSNEKLAVFMKELQDEQNQQADRAYEEEKKREEIFKAEIVREHELRQAVLDLIKMEQKELEEEMEKKKQQTTNSRPGKTSSVDALKRKYKKEFEEAEKNRRKNMEMND